jgi:hypothetical protein
LIGLGNKLYDGYDEDWSKGLLNHAPKGLGRLLVNDYMEDARVLYCPSSSGMRSPIQWEDGAQIGIYDLGQWKAAGGFDGETLVYGDYEATDHLKTNQMNGEARESWIFSHYAYRLQPFMTAKRTPHKYHAQTLDTWNTLNCSLPHVKINVGCPEFRTVKQLGDRAVVSDAFGKGAGNADPLGRDITWLASGAWGWSGPPLWMGRTIPGFGITAHRTGYNVLYGGGHVLWYGDTREEILWHAQSRSGSGTSQDDGLNVLSSTTREFKPHWYAYGPYCWWARPYDPNSTYGIRDDADHSVWKVTPQAIWHRFDMHNGVDVIDGPRPYESWP